MKILLLVQNYPSSFNKYAMSYVHTRALGYLRVGCSVTVISFSTHEDYQYEGVSVVTYKKSLDFSSFDVVVSHAPNLKNHIRIIFEKISQISSLIFVFHGHEILNYNKYYPRPYSWLKKDVVSYELRRPYEFIKLYFMKIFMRYFNTRSKMMLIFVSDWMKSQFESQVDSIKNYRCEIVHNPINDGFISQFRHENIDSGRLKVITIRPFDQPKYGIDLVLKLALQNSDIDFDIYGRGKYFSYYEKPNNVNIINEFIEQKDIPALLNKYDIAVMPTRLDSQGVSVCEFASYGIPLITSDIDVMNEMVGHYPNVLLLNNENFECVLNKELIKKLKNSNFFDEKFLLAKIVEKEIEIFNKNDN
ncbi:glycosyltransferase family 4 protein [Vibrio cholerae]|nr:glycosyltransferase family 4 protein [Vibrio cholerae]